MKCFPRVCGAAEGRWYVFQNGVSTLSQTTFQSSVFIPFDEKFKYDAEEIERS